MDVASQFHFSRWAFVLGVALFLDMPGAHAKRLALVMGNDNYQNVSKLKKAGNDAEAMAKELRAAGFEVDLHRDLDYRSMIKATEALYNAIQGGDEVVVFYAGHGLQIKSGNYLLPVDIEATTESAVEKTAYALNDLSEKLDAAKAAFSLIVVDACRDNPLKTKGRSVGGERGLSPPDPPLGQMIVYSASRGEQALDRLSNDDANPNSVFTREFIARMRKRGVRVEDLVRETQVSVEKLAGSIGHKQRPALYNEVRGNFYFFAPVTVVVPPPVAAAPAVPDAVYQAQREDRFWDDAKVAGNRAGFEAYLEQYQNGRYASLARANINRLAGDSANKPNLPIATKPSPVSGQAVSPVAPSSAAAEKTTTVMTAPATVAVPPPGMAAETAPVVPKKADIAGVPDSATGATQPQKAAAKTANRITFPNGDRYEGELTGDTRNGAGIYWFVNGDRYDVNFVNNRFHGKGTLTSVSGEVYSGDFERGIKHGQGTYKFANGNRYEGSFVDNIFSGKGIILLVNGDRYEGDILNGVKHGRGIHFFATKDRYEGSFESGVQSGNGTHFYANGDRYEGSFSNGVRHGKGVYHFANGLLKAQEFVNGVEKE